MFDHLARDCGLVGPEIAAQKREAERGFRREVKGRVYNVKEKGLRN